MCGPLLPTLVWHLPLQVLLARAAQDYPAANPPPLRFIRSCSSALAPATLEALEATFKVRAGVGGGAVCCCRAGGLPRACLM